MEVKLNTKQVLYLIYLIATAFITTLAIGSLIKDTAISFLLVVGLGLWGWMQILPLLFVMILDQLSNKKEVNK